MDSSIVASGIQSVLEEDYNMLLEVNKRLRQVQAGIYRASLKWRLLPGSLETSDRPEYWADPSGRDTWSVPPEMKPEMKGWDFGIRTDDLVGSGEIVRAVLKALGDLKKNLEDIQHRLRLNVNKLSRPGLRSYNILNMPEETLYCIFEFVEGFLWDFPELECGATRDIKNCRLTCQAFNRVSERFFLRSVSVDLNASSLSRFNDISNHPTISKSIQSIRAILHFYDTTLGDSLQDFILYNADALYDRAETLELMAPWEIQETISKETGMNVVEALKEASAC
uniref:F-box domain-containing protein n=1 Tax=Bionectria ochroleuca TaxID=29856 RepID=A0A8H7TW61_BIOOC